MTHVTNLEYKEKPDYKRLLKLVENLAIRERIDLYDGIFDWNLIKASRYLYTNPFQNEQQN